MNKPEEEILCAFCKEKVATKRLQITTEHGASFAVLLCVTCASECKSLEVLGDEN